YHVFDLYKVHQDAELLDIKFVSPDYSLNGKKIPALNFSASKDINGVVNISIVNLDATKEISLTTDLGDLKWNDVSGELLTSANLSDINTFEKPDLVKLQKFSKGTKNGSQLLVKIPPHAIVNLSLK
ncbi:MAG: alpha-N-arabinofuranosidase, partial [Flavobacterium psychrophilum]